MITISAKDFDLDGSVTLEENPSNSDLLGTSRRVVRTATLDGDADVDDAGFSQGDRTFTIYIKNILQADFETLQRIQRLYSVHRCATADGLFEGVIESLRLDAGEAVVQFLVESRLSQ